MKKLIILTGLITLFSCDSQDDSIYILPDGVYTGTFSRELVWEQNAEAQVTLTFDDGEWSGTSEFDKYPALCHGTYSVIGDTVVFTNDCVWTADFDWSLILAGKFLLIQTSEGLELTKDDRSSTSDTFIDRYRLVRER